MAGPTSMPYRKAFAFAGVACAAAFIPALLADRPGPAIEQGTKIAILALLLAGVIGYRARRSSRPWSLWRFGGIYFVSITIVLVLYMSQSMGTGQSVRTGTPPPSRQAILDQLRANTATTAQGGPNVVDLMSERFPIDLNNLIDQLAQLVAAAGTRDELAATQFEAQAKVLATIQARDGNKLQNAPIDSLRALIGAQRDAMAAFLGGNEVLCVKPRIATTQPLKLLAGLRLYRLLAAIADGRDRGTARAAATADDYTQFFLLAKRRGMAVSDWDVLPDQDRPSTAEPSRVCKAFVSLYEAALKTDGELGERVLADLAQALLATDAADVSPGARH
jgi:hypothetical protein